jgi:hypothetical protein
MLCRRNIKVPRSLHLYAVVLQTTISKRSVVFAEQHRLYVQRDQISHHIKSYFLFNCPTTRCDYGWYG